MSAREKEHKVWREKVSEAVVIVSLSPLGILTNNPNTSRSPSSALFICLSLSLSLSYRCFTSGT